MSLRLRKALCLLLTFGMLLGIEGCGGKGATSTSESSVTVSSSAGENTSSNAPADSGNDDIEHEQGFVLMNDSPVTVYKIGADTLAFYIQNDQCALVLPSDGEESKTCLKLVSSNKDVTVTFSSFGGNLVFRSKQGETVTLESEYGSNYISEKTGFYTFTGIGLCDAVSFAGEYSLAENDGTIANEKNLVTVDVTDRVKTISLSEYEQVISEVYSVDKPQCDWEGTFMTARDSEYPGIVTIDVMDNGLLKILTHFDGKDRILYGKEYIFPDSVDALFGGYAMLLNPPTDVFVNLQYSRILYYETYFHNLTYTLMTGSGEDKEYKTIKLSKFAEWHKAPMSYEDKDTTGKMHREDPEDSKYFKPASDDYVIEAYYDTRKLESLSCDTYILYSFDVNGHEIDQHTKTVFNSADDAKTYYDSLEDDMYYLSGCYQEGEIVYEIVDSGSNNKNDILSRAYGTWYLDSHYIYGYTNDDGSVYDMYYVSKPYTAAEYSVSLDDVLYWVTMPYGDHRSTENSETILTAEVNSVSTYILFDGKVDEDNHSFAPLGETRVHGLTIEGSSISNEYDYESDSYKNYINFTEIEFGDKATVTQYRFALADPLDASITFDNYKSKTPDLVLTQEYDMTTAIDYGDDD
ncbi:MAG: hypothetical protein K6A38_09640 [Lachnospiraceae bacterium]|nr:hypothetical protein [Lachnospiraceae bacterium]